MLFGNPSLVIINMMLATPRAPLFNPYIRVAQCVLACGLFAHEDSLDVPRLYKPCFLHSILEGTRIDPSLFFSDQLLSAATNSTNRIVIGGILTPIVR